MKFTFNLKQDLFLKLVTAPQLLSLKLYLNKDFGFVFFWMAVLYLVGIRLK